MANKSIRQNQPRQVCDHLNTWSYGLIAVREAATEQAAIDAAKAEAEQQAQQALDNERQAMGGRCPNTCQGGRLKGNQQPVLKSILTFQDTDRNVWVSYYSARWKSQLKCRGVGNAINYKFAARTQSLSTPQANPACGKTRFYSGCTLGFGAGTDATRAKNAAENAAKVIAQAALNAAKKKSCPNNCKPGQKTAPDEPSVVSLDAYRIFQIMQPVQLPFRSTTYVGYAVAYWTVTITCSEPAKLKKKKKGKKKVKKNAEKKILKKKNIRNKTQKDNKANKPTLYDLLSFIENKINRLPHGVEEIDNACNALQRLSTSAKEKLDNKQYAEACWTFFYIGKSFKMISKKGLKILFDKSNAEIQALELHTSKMHRKEGLLYTHEYAKATKEYAQEIAKELWNLDKTNKINLDSMSQHVWEKLTIENIEVESYLGDLDQDEINKFKYLKNALPDKVDGIKDWLRPVAPPYAR